VERNAARSSAWLVLHLSLTFSRLLGATPCSTSQPTSQIFLAGAVAKLQSILRSCGCGVGGVERNAACYSAYPNLHISLTFSRLLVF